MQQRKHKKNSRHVCLKRECQWEVLHYEKIDLVTLSPCHPFTSHLVTLSPCLLSFLRLLPCSSSEFCSRSCFIQHLTREFQWKNLHYEKIDLVTLSPCHLSPCHPFTSHLVTLSPCLLSFLRLLLCSSSEFYSRSCFIQHHKYMGSADTIIW
jgi:hypothetical protein